MTTTMHLAYCRDCEVVIATVPPRVRGERPPVSPFRHTVKGAAHTAALVEVPWTPLQAKEAPGEYLLRLLKVHKKSLR